MVCITMLYTRERVCSKPDIHWQATEVLNATHDNNPSQVLRLREVRRLDVIAQLVVVQRIAGILPTSDIVIGHVVMLFLTGALLLPFSLCYTCVRREYASIEAGSNRRVTTAQAGGGNADRRVLEAGDVAGDYSADWKGEP